MKKVGLILLILFSCKKELRFSDEVIVTVTNECNAKIFFYHYDTDEQYLSDIFDCNYVSMIAIKAKPGTYKVKAETPRGKPLPKRLKKACTHKR